MKIGILAVQGDFEAHAKMLARVGAEYVLVKSPVALAGLAGVILPGGESSTHLKLLTEEGLFDALRQFAAEGGALFGTCAGAILLAREVKNPPQTSLGLVDMVVVRNGYGRQLASHVGSGASRLKAEPLEMVFIRAPIIESVGGGVEVLAVAPASGWPGDDPGQSENRPVLVRQGKILAATFHPELTEDPTVHEYFLRVAANGH